MSLSEVFKNIKVVRDFPKEGIVFRHFGPLLKNTELFKYTIRQLYNSSDNKYDVVCGLDARGFIISTAIQNLFDIPQVMIRKKSKLPGEKYTYEYKKEYGIDILELEVDSIKSGDRVLIVDDLMATAGTLLAAANLVEQAGGTVSGIMVLVEFSDLGGREKLTNLYPRASICSLFSLDSSNDTQILDENVVIPSRLRSKKFRPTVYPMPINPISDEPISDNRPVLMWHNSVESFAKKMLQVSNLRASNINWNYFPDTWPNITFEPSTTLINKDLIFIMSVSRKEIFTEQLALLVALPRQLINSLTIVIPYLGPATHERVDYSGQLATVEPLLKILSSCIPMTKTGPPIVRIFDIHALQTRFYTNDNVTMKLTSAIPVLLDYLKTKKERYVIAYPDDGSYKRFRYFFEDFPQVICSKMRDGDIRKIIIRERINWPEDRTLLDKLIIIDDLVQSGETILSCAKALKSLGFNSVSAYTTHAIFPNGAWKKFTDNGAISEFIITNTNPEISDLLIGIKPFIVLDVQTHLCSELHINNNNIKTSIPKKIVDIYVASTNIDKLVAVYEASLNDLCGSSIFPDDSIFEVYSVDGISSGISSQPLGFDETSVGAKNRLKSCMSIIKKEDAIYISVENGIIQEGDKYHDVAVVIYKRPCSDLEILIASNSIAIPEIYNGLVDESLKSVGRYATFGSIFEKKFAIKDWHKFVSGISRKNLIRNSMLLTNF